MTIEIQCDYCAKRLRLPDALRGRKAKCPHCGTTVTTSPAPEQVGPDKAADPVERIDDLESACPHCDAPMTEDAVLCVECGYDARTGKRLKTVAKRYKGHWESDFPLVARVLFCLGSVVAGAVLFGVLAVKVHPFLFLLLIPWTAASLLNFGDFRSVDVERTRKGKLLVTAHSYFAFLPVGSRTVDAARCNAIMLDYSVHPNYALIAVFIVMCFLAPPVGIIRLIRLLGRAQNQQESFRLVLRGIRERDDLLVYKGRSQSKMSAIVDMIQGVANLPLERR